MHDPIVEKAVKGNKQFQTKTVKFLGEEYEVVPKEAVGLTEGLITVWKKLGKPEDLSTESGLKMLDNITHCWYKYFWEERNDWLYDRSVELTHERSVKQSAKAGGYVAAVYPPTWFHLMKAFFPKLRMGNREVVKQIIKRQPILKATNLDV